MSKPSLKRIMEALQSPDGHDIGFCTSCGAAAFGVEPDAEKYPCESCGKNSVYGAEELLVRRAK